EQIGSWLMRYWDMPDELATALRFQHDPTYDGAYAEYPNLVCLAVRLLRSRGIGSGPDEDIPDALLERVGLTRDKANDVVSKVLEAEVLLRELASQFSQA
ncbi:MAG: histidine kinase, partial [Pseudomonas mandelii]